VDQFFRPALYRRLLVTSGCCYIMVNFADISDERGAFRLLPAWMSGAFALARPPAPLATAPTTCSAAAQAHKQCQLPQS
jgi:hypothetical protein